MTYCAECGAELTEDKQVCQICGNFLFTKEIIARKIKGTQEKMILFWAILLILVGMIEIIYVTAVVPLRYRGPILYGAGVFSILFGLFFILTRNWLLNRPKKDILKALSFPIPGLRLSESKIYCYSCGAENITSHQICTKCQEILLNEEIIFEGMTHNSRKLYSVLGPVSFLFGIFFAYLYIQYNLTFFWLLVCFYLIISGFLLIVIPKKISDWDINRFLNGINKVYATD